MRNSTSDVTISISINIDSCSCADTNAIDIGSSDSFLSLVVKIVGPCSSICLVREILVEEILAWGGEDLCLTIGGSGTRSGDVSGISAGEVARYIADGVTTIVCLVGNCSSFNNVSGISAGEVARYIADGAKTEVGIVVSSFSNVVIGT